MKTLRSTLTTLASLSALAGSLAHSQEAPPSLPALPAPPQAHVAGFSTPTHALAAVPHLAQAQVAHEAIALAQAPGQWPNAPVAWTSDGDGILVDVLGIHRPRTLVIRTGEPDPKASSSLEEDISIMSRILAKAVNEKAGDDDAMTAMGMKLKALTLSGHSTVQNLYLDGYGALFLLSVRFPLVAPPEPAKEETRQAPANSAWEETRRELFGSKEPVSGGGKLFFKESSREAYDAKKVAKLKESLVEALSNAANIRDLKADEFVTVVVTGSDNAPVARAVKRIESGSEGASHTSGASRRLHSVVKRIESGGEGTNQVFTFSSGGRTLGGSLGRSSAGETTMTVRAKKSDIDAFAKGDLKLEDFQKRVASATY